MLARGIVDSDNIRVKTSSFCFCIFIIESFSYLTVSSTVSLRSTLHDFFSPSSSFFDSPSIFYSSFEQYDAIVSLRPFSQLRNVYDLIFICFEHLRKLFSNARNHPIRTSSHLSWRTILRLSWRLVKQDRIHGHKVVGRYRLLKSRGSIWVARGPQCPENTFSDYLASSKILRY